MPCDDPNQLAVSTRTRRALDIRDTIGRESKARPPREKNMLHAIPSLVLVLLVDSFPRAEDKPVVSIFAADLWRECKGNIIAAEEKYKGKTIELKGTPTGVFKQEDRTV